MQHHVIGSSFIFQHDKHIANAVKEYVDRKHTVEHYQSVSHHAFTEPGQFYWNNVGSSRQRTEQQIIIQRRALNIFEEAWKTIPED